MVTSMGGVTQRMLDACSRSPCDVCQCVCVYIEDISLITSIDGTDLRYATKQNQLIITGVYLPFPEECNQTHSQTLDADQGTHL
jgi:hypothetical protein